MNTMRKIMSSLNRVCSFRKIIVLGFIFAVVGCDNGKDDSVTVKPKAIDSTLVNPGRGFTTTGATFNEDIQDRRHPQSGVVQMRWYWDKIEPKEGEIDFAFIDSMIAKAAKNGQQLNFRIMTQNVKMRVPQWFVDKGAEKPYYKDPMYYDEQDRLIRALAERYDGNPDIAFVDIGSLGQWAEWHSTMETAGIKMPSKEKQERIIDMYTDNFKKTPLVMLIGGNRNGMLEYAIDRGAGWRADCWGDMGTRWGHMKGFYADALTSSKVSNAWKQAPIALETCWTMEHWHEKGWDIDYILSKALEWHATSVNNGSQAIPKEWWPKVQEFEKQLGYRYVLEEANYASTVKPGGQLSYSMEWNNKGVAPVYQQYPLVFQIRSANDSSQEWTLKTDADLTKWMPGKTSLASKVDIPDEIPEGEYELYLGILNRERMEPAIKLAIEGRTPDGWYKLGKIQVENL